MRIAYTTFGRTGHYEMWRVQAWSGAIRPVPSSCFFAPSIVFAAGVAVGEASVQLCDVRGVVMCGLGVFLPCEDYRPTASCTFCPEDGDCVLLFSLIANQPTFAAARSARKVNTRIIFCSVVLSFAVQPRLPVLFSSYLKFLEIPCDGSVTYDGRGATFVKVAVHFSLSEGGDLSNRFLVGKGSGGRVCPLA